VSGGTADLFQCGIGDANPRQSVDQQQLPLERRQSRGILGQNLFEQRPHAKSLGSLALEHDVGDASFDHLDANAAALNVLRRDDRPAEVETRTTIEVAHALGDRGKVGLRDDLSEIGLIRAMLGAPLL